MLTFHRRVGKDHQLLISFSDRTDGDARSPSFLLGAGRGPIFPHQIHGADAAFVSEWASEEKFECDALITEEPEVSIGIRIADCVPIAIYGLSTTGPVLAVVHAGWRGIRDGVVTNVVERLAQAGCREPRAIVGPHISVEEYEFGTEDLAQLVESLGERVAGRTKDGSPALDLRAAVEVTLERDSVTVDYVVNRCSAQDPRYWSYRSSRDEERFALVGEIRLV
ncbi:MAG TPA: hypothetical protein DCX77_11190 [Acidimicrobiaceae bacterium]|nr:hypothetical protein [Acidimicrobiaceae bacterium]HAX06233.1 hypothetical protein [Acidimicrobiaceae bacterium]